MNSPPFVSVLVPCRNEAAFIERSLSSILTSDYPPASLEVIVADGRSTDGTRELLSKMVQGIAHSDRRLRVIDNPEGLTPVALNRAIAAARGEILLRFDGHAVMPPGYIRRTVDLLVSSGADNAGGSIRTLAQSDGFFSAAIALALTSRFGVGDSSFRTRSDTSGPRAADTVFAGCWRRELFDRLGGFNERLARGQDMEFNLRIRRAGGTIVLDPTIVCDYYARSTLSSFWRHNFRNGVWAVLPFALSDVIPVRPRHLIPLAFVASLALSFTLLPFPWSMAVAAVYGAANLIASAHAAFKVRKPSYLLRMPLVFFSLHLAYGLGSAWGSLQCLLKFAQTGVSRHATNPQA
jgi:succinoglycan biosynthesis protein ExoA